MSQTENEPQPFTLSMKKYFGLKPEQNNQGFSAELKELDEKNRLYFAEQLEASGVVIKDIDVIRTKAAGVIQQ